jgi:hypothetical protein
METKRSTRREYLAALDFARTMAPKVKDATSAPQDMPKGARFYLATDGLTGFGITQDGTLIGLFSLTSHGSAAVKEAVKRGARHLDCFDGFLPTYYARFGFKVTRREANWTPGGPDVVFMSV